MTRRTLRSYQPQRIGLLTPNGRRIIVPDGARESRRERYVVQPPADQMDGANDRAEARMLAALGGRRG